MVKDFLLKPEAVSLNERMDTVYFLLQSNETISYSHQFMETKDCFNIFPVFVLCEMFPVFVL